MLLLFSAATSNILSRCFRFVNNFFHLFSNSFFKVCRSSMSAEGGIWTLAPLLTTYSLSRGAPSTTWVLLHLVESHPAKQDLVWNSAPESVSIFLRILSTVSGESGIRTHAPLRTNGFQDRLVMTTSISLQSVLSNVLLHSIERIAFCQALFFIFFQKFFPVVFSLWKRLETARFYMLFCRRRSASATAMSSGVVTFILE